MRTVSYAIAVISVGMIIAMSTVAYTTLLLESEKAGFQQAAAVLDTSLVADYLVTHYTSYCDGSMAYGNPDINPIFMVSARDADNNGEYDYVDRINEVNNGKFDIYSGDVKIQLNDEDKSEISSVTQSITYSASTQPCDWEEYHTGINFFRTRAALSYISSFIRPAVDKVTTIDTILDVLEWVRGLHTSSGETGDLETIPSIAARPVVPFDMTPAMTQTAEINYAIPVIITEGDTAQAEDASAAAIHKLEVNARVTFYDVRQYFEQVSEAWEY